MTMVGTLQKEIKQTRPFESLAQEAFLNLQRTSDFLLRRVANGLKPYGITPPQFNVLRILRGAGGKGLITREIGERMITAVPDVTRMIDRIEALGLIYRERGLADRRLVTVCIADSGLKLLSELDIVFEDFHEVLFGECSEQEITELIGVLEKLRSGKTGKLQKK